MLQQREHQKQYKSKDYTDNPARKKEIFDTILPSKFVASGTKPYVKCILQKKSITNAVKLSLIIDFYIFRMIRKSVYQKYQTNSTILLS